MRLVGRFGLSVAFLGLLALAACGGAAEPKITAEDVWSRPSMVMTMDGDEAGSEEMGGSAGEMVAPQSHQPWRG